MDNTLSKYITKTILAVFCFIALLAQANEKVISADIIVYKNADGRVELAPAKSGEKIFIITDNGDWLRIAWGNRAGWVKAESLLPKPTNALNISQGKEEKNSQKKCSKCPNKYPTRLQSHEPNFLGLTNDDNDVPFLDFIVSLKFPLFWNGTFPDQESDRKRKFPYLYFGFTGRFGQYIVSRDSSPVIGKRFNPELIARYWLDKEQSHIDFSFGHESNGQSINSEAEYLDERSDLINQGQDPEFARDFISRGWDYLGINAQKNFVIKEDGQNIYGLGLKLRYFLKDGPFQGKAENHEFWENDGANIFRKQYDGITTSASFKRKGKWFPEVILSYTTGYEDIFENNTFRISGSARFGKNGLPIDIWASTGFNSDLVDYYKRTTSFGISFKLKTYLGQETVNSTD